MYSYYLQVIYYEEANLSVLRLFWMSDLVVATRRRDFKSGYREKVRCVIPCLAAWLRILSSRGIVHK